MPHPKKLSQEQEEQARELAATRAHIIHEVISREGRDETERSASSLAWSGFAAGLSMGLSLLACGILRARLPNLPWSWLVYNLGYPVGFVVVILGRQQLYTENTLTPVVPFLEAPNRERFWKLIRLWTIVCLTNLIGAGLFGWLCTNSLVFSPEIRAAFQGIGQTSIDSSFWGLLVKGLFGGWLIALLTWVLGGVKSGEVALIFLVTYIVAIGGFGHIVAGMVDVSYLLAVGTIGWSKLLGGFLLPTLIGNTIGGVGFVAVVNHGQVVAGSD